MTDVIDDARLRRLAATFRRVREASERLARPLSPEDQTVQSMPDASPTKWHLAHVTWFFETFVLRPRDVAPFRREYDYLFNSYYNSVGEQYPRPERGLVTRPGVAEVLDYRRYVDDEIQHLLDGGELDGDALDAVEIGLHHEQQHQELLLMDVKHVLSRHPLHPAYDAELPAPPPESAPERSWLAHGGGTVDIGHAGDGFSYDNERPRHAVLLQPHRLASRATTNAEYLEFVEDGGYDDPRPWLADGWSTVRREGWRAPLYWVRRDDGWHEFTLGGLRPLAPSAPVCHVSYYEADAFADWAGARLPEEAEWESVAAGRPVEGNFADDGALHPRPAPPGRGAQQLFGDVWEWTRSAYAPYPGYRAPEGAIGEYNGKFMCGQYVLRGGCCVTPSGHARASYRNFFYPHQRWAFAGIRLATDGA